MSRSTLSVIAPSTLFKPRLNYDILFHIITVSEDTSTTLLFMRTCRTVYNHGISVLLKSPVKIRDYHQLKSFCLFLLREPSPRIRWLRQLELAVSWGPFKWGRRRPVGEEADQILNLLAQVLELARRLEDLDIHSFEDLLDSAPQLKDVFSRLAGLHALSISGFGDANPSALSHFGGTPLRRLHLYYSHQHNITESLSLFGDTLEQLHITGPAFFGGDRPAMSFVTKLTLEHFNLWDLDVGALVTLFPNLKSLSLIGTTGDAADGFWNSLSDDNRKSLRQGGWPRLSYIQGSLLDLYVLGVGSPVRQLELVDVHDSELSSLCHVLQTLQPSHLTLKFAIDWYEPTMATLAQRVPLSSHTTYHPTHLRLDLIIGQAIENPAELVGNVSGIAVALCAENLILSVSYGSLDADVSKHLGFVDPQSLGQAIHSSPGFGHRTVEIMENGVVTWGADAARS